MRKCVMPHRTTNTLIRPIGCLDSILVILAETNLPSSLCRRGRCFQSLLSDIEDMRRFSSDVATLTMKYLFLQVLQYMQIYVRKYRPAYNIIQLLTSMR